jgi:hypothetical protein
MIGVNGVLAKQIIGWPCILLTTLAPVPLRCTDTILTSKLFFEHKRDDDYWAMMNQITRDNEIESGGIPMERR